MSIGSVPEVKVGMNNNPRKEVDSKIILEDPSDEREVEQYARIKKEAGRDIEYVKSELRKTWAAKKRGMVPSSIVEIVDSVFSDISKSQVRRCPMYDKPHGHPPCKYVPLSFALMEDKIVEQVQDGYVVWNRTDDSGQLVDHIHTGDYVDNPKYKVDKHGRSNGQPKMIEVVLTPLRNKTFTSGQITLAIKPEPATGLLDIITEIENKIQKWYYCSPEEMHIFRIQIRLAVASWFLHVYDNIKTPEKIAGLLSTVGTSQGGKKRFLTIMRMISYRPIYVLNSTKIPSIYRMVEPWGNASLMVDEADQREGDSQSEWIQFFNARYEGTPISRFNSQRGENDVFQSFGLTAVALRKMQSDEGFTSRMIKLTATTSPVALPEIAGPDIIEDFQEIRNKLLYLRLKYYGRLKFVGSSGLPVEHSWRGKEVLTLLKVLAQIDPALDQDISKMSEDLTNRERENLSQTWDGVILNFIFDFINSEDVLRGEHRGCPFFSKKVKSTDNSETTKPLTLSLIAKSLNTTSTDISRSIAQFKMKGLEKFRLEGREIRGVICFPFPKDTDRSLQKYVPSYQHELLSKLDKGAQSVLFSPIEDM